MDHETKTVALLLQDNLQAFGVSTSVNPFLPSAGIFVVQTVGVDPCATTLPFSSISTSGPESMSMNVLYVCSIDLAHVLATAKAFHHLPLVSPLQAQQYGSRYCTSPTASPSTSAPPIPRRTRPMEERKVDLRASATTQAWI